MKNMLSAFLNRSTKNRLLFYFLLLSLGPLIMASVIIYQISSQAITESAVNNAVESVEAALYNMEQVFTEASSVCKVVINDANTQQRMRMSYSTRAERFSADLQGGMELSSIVGQRSSIFGLYVLGENGSCFKSNMYSFRKPNFYDDQWYQSTISQSEPLWYKMHAGSFIVKTLNETFITVCVPYVDKASGRINGVVAADIEESAITDFVEREINEKGYFLLLDVNNEVIYQSRNDAFSSNLQNDVLKQIVNDDTDDSETSNAPRTILTPKVLVVYQKSPTTQWKIVGVIPTDSIYHSVNNIVGLTISMIIIFGAVAIYTSLYLSKKYTTPITNMQESMKQVEDGDLQVYLEPTGEDEFANLAKSFNHMVKRIRALINIVYEKQALLRKSEYKALEAQINPHFLYNSLDSIIWLLKMKQPDDAITMLNNLVILFRIALSKGNELIYIQKEIQHIESYLIIQSMRYSKKFDYQLDVPEKLLKFKTLKLLLQPLVENAIYHGLSESKPKLSIRIEVSETDERIEFKVMDNGAGIPEETLEQLQKSMINNDAATSKNESESYGLRNVNGRIKAYFGDEFGLEINSVYQEGTTIIVSIPKAYDDE